MNDIVIPTYIINVPKRTDRLAHILTQFANKCEFEINIVEASEHNIGAVGLWQSICRVINMAIDKDEDVIILCKDDHQFTNDYDKNKLIEAIYDVHNLNANFLLGGILAGFSNVLPVGSGLFWLDTFWGTQFVVVFKSFFETILTEPFLDRDVADSKFSEMTSNKFVMYPMISIQRDFGYSDIAQNYDVDEMLQNSIHEASIRIKKIHEVYEQALKYKTL